MRGAFAVVAALAFAAPSTVAAQADALAEAGDGYELVWADEFEKDGLPDPDKWVWDTHANRTGWYNEELQYYADRRAENARVEDGKLIITARKEALRDEADWGGQEYSSARLITRGKAEWTYGMFEVRAKLPCGEGSWPAIWMLGTTQGWPDGGEIDIMEHVGKTPADVFGTIHNRSTAGTSGDGGSIKVEDACAAFHDYQMVWTPDLITIAVDGTPFHRYRNAGTGNAQWPFDKPQYMLLNLAVGGAMGGAVDDWIFPIRFEVEHVRVYQKR
ncbi:glycoside hydrolase family 16 protein [Alteriqipengyuania sp. 357]